MVGRVVAVTFPAGQLRVSRFRRPHDLGSRACRPGSPRSTRRSCTWSSRPPRCTSARCPCSAGPVSGFDYDRLVELIEQRIALVPRYRQKVRQVPGNLARPVWVDDPDFDVAYHVRRSALPRPARTTS